MYSSFYYPLLAFAGGVPGNGQFNLEMEIETGQKNTLLTPTMFETISALAQKKLQMYCDGSDSRSVSGCFFLGKALAEALNERIESTVGELLSSVGRLQAEQQKQVQDFQEEVLERAKRAKEKAAREAMEHKGLFPSLLE
ncbi:hypothetical protein HHK36_032968 [Tetracentron sinense]|uniref:Uncharacterized protein n=1 Tax=Tetracentron sinense TaxID=13715 RepID=A0A834Y9F4_TETSI|nr:hypothetical protein HHK36_032968 [Tetracentron sinense]